MPTLTEDEWQRALVAYLKQLMKAKDLDFRTLSQRLAEKGIALDRVPLANKINRGTFSAGFLMQILDALQTREDWLEEVAQESHSIDKG